jgi:hypothetical protein
VLWDPLIVVPGAAEPRVRTLKRAYDSVFKERGSPRFAAPNWGANPSKSRRDGQGNRFRFLFRPGDTVALLVAALASSKAIQRAHPLRWTASHPSGDTRDPPMSVESYSQLALRNTAELIRLYVPFPVSSQARTAGRAADSSRRVQTVNGFFEPGVRGRGGPPPGRTVDRCTRIHRAHERESFRCPLASGRASPVRHA